MPTTMSNAMEAHSTRAWAALRGAYCLHVEVSSNVPVPSLYRLYIFTKTVRSGAKQTQFSKTTTAMVSRACLKCGATKKSGKRSCCAPGGAWFKNCGDAGDIKFDHTWTEGVQACKSTLS